MVNDDVQPCALHNKVQIRLTAFKGCGLSVSSRHSLYPSQRVYDVILSMPTHYTSMTTTEWGCRRGIAEYCGPGTTP